MADSYDTGFMGEDTPAQKLEQTRAIIDGLRRFKDIQSKKLSSGDWWKSQVSLDTPKNQDAVDVGNDIAVGFTPGLGTLQAGRDFERSRREGSKLGMGLSALGMLPLAGGIIKSVKGAANASKNADVVGHLVTELRNVNLPATALEETGVVAKFDANTMQQLAEGLRRGRNSEKLSNEIIKSGDVAAQDREALKNEAAAIKEKIMSRQLARPGRDALSFGVMDKLKSKLNKERTVTSYMNVPISESWSKPNIENVRSYAGIDTGMADEAARRATVEAIVRELRKTGSKVVHTSKAGKLASSRYLQTPTGRVVRISDHEIPQTAQRDYMSAVHGGASKYDVDLIVDDWRNKTLKDYLNEIHGTNLED